LHRDVVRLVTFQNGFEFESAFYFFSFRIHTEKIMGQKSLCLCLPGIFLCALFSWRVASIVSLVLYTFGGWAISSVEEEQSDQHSNLTMQLIDPHKQEWKLPKPFYLVNEDRDPMQQLWKQKEGTLRNMKIFALLRKEQKALNNQRNVTTAQNPHVQIKKIKNNV